VDSISLCTTPHHGPSFTFRGFNFSVRSGETIDFVFLRNHSGCDVARHGTLADHRDGRYPSDHLPVVVELLLTPDRG
jgi:endonuclease/exonuclease/phosphatase family metal-dependent hydrolase